MPQWIRQFLALANLRKGIIILLVMPLVLAGCQSSNMMTGFSGATINSEGEMIATFNVCRKDALEVQLVHHDGKKEVIDGRWIAIFPRTGFFTLNLNHPSTDWIVESGFSGVLDDDVEYSLFAVSSDGVNTTWGYEVTADKFADMKPGLVLLNGNNFSLEEVEDDWCKYYVGYGG